MVESEMAANGAVKRKRVVILGVAVVLLALVGLAAWRYAPRVFGNPHQAKAGGVALPAEFAHSCVYLLPGPTATFDVSVSDFATAVHRPDAELVWEKSATGYILRQTINDQVSNTTKRNAFSFTSLDAKEAQQLGETSPECGPGVAVLDRIVTDDGELNQVAVNALALQLLGPVAAAHDEARQAQAAKADPSTKEIPAYSFPAGLDEMYKPKDKTVAGVVAMARDVCRRTGTDDAPATPDVLEEWAQAKTKLFDLAKEYGYQLSASDQACYKDGEDELNQAAQRDEGQADPATTQQ